MIQMETRKRRQIVNFDEQQHKTKQKQVHVRIQAVNLLANKQNVYTARVDLVKEWERS